jgi:hypothetical protein
VQPSKSVMTNSSQAASSSTERAQTSTQDFIKLIISLASGVIALSATFVPKFSDHSPITMGILFVSWLLFAASIFFGIRTLTILTRCIMNGTELWWNQIVRTARLCWWCFLIGIGALIIFAGIAFWVDRQSCHRNLVYSQPLVPLPPNPTATP